MRWRPLIIAAACAFILELTLRIGLGLGDPPLVVLDDEIEYRLVPNETYRRYGNRIEINSHGMRAPDHNVTALENERRVLLIGDSVVYGNHFLDQEETITLRLKGYLENDQRFAGCTFVTMPAAASSWGPVNQAAFVAETGTLDADLALHIVSAHDLYDTPGGKDSSLIPYRTRRSFGALEDALQIAVERAKRRFLSGPSNVTPPEERRAETLAAMNRLLGQLQSQSVPLILIYHPTVPEQRNGLRFAHAQFAEWARSEDIPFLSLTNENLGDPNMYRDDIHPAAQGADFIARFLGNIALQQFSPC
jgi:hypothetical protein